MLRYRDADQIAREWEREDLRTPEQRERAVTALGPSGLWLHFLGADARFSDAWALPETVVSLVDLTESWLNFCAGMEISDRQQCTIQLGDLAWYNDRRPDPLGHKDHYSGQCVDLRLFRSDGSRYEAYWNRPDDRPGRGVGYDRVLTQAFVDFARDRAAIDVVYFNDPEVSGVETARGHDDHIHLCFAQPERGIHDRDEP